MTPRRRQRLTLAASITGAVLVAVDGTVLTVRTARPLLPAALLRSPAVGPALGVLLAASAAVFGTLFPATYFL
ncbi:hypothetical protein ACH4E7_12420 [Kitasatospora sp. NPDC018058]|uniref:hypothetical protein n=1 Tax=Kitasatospora sp. NPDC018058 TaxID=3364025 RepID=UPI0037BF2C79